MLLTYDQVDQLGRGKLQQGVAQLQGGRTEPHGAKGADQRGQDRDGLPVPEGDPPVPIVLLVPVTLPDGHDPGTPERNMRYGAILIICLLVSNNYNTTVQDDYYGQRLGYVDFNLVVPLAARFFTGKCLGARDGIAVGQDHKIVELQE